MLAGVSVEYVTRLEQGRDRHPSPEVLAALAEALHLAPSERVHLYRLTKATGPGFHCLGGAQPNRVVRPQVRAILDQLEPAPAVVINRLTEVLAYTDGYARLVARTGMLDGGLPANIIRYVLTDPRATTTFPDWGHMADRAVATLKQGPYQSDPAVAALIDELRITVGPAFIDRFATVPGLPPASSTDRLFVAELGELRLNYEALELSADDDQTLLTYLPADPATAAVLDALAGRRPGALRAVSG